MSDKEQRKLPGGYVLDHLFIKPYGSRPNEELKKIFTEFNIYESLFHPYGLYGEVIVSDALNFMKYVPIIGEEFFQIFFRDFDKKDAFSNFRQMPITGIGKQLPIGDAIQLYNINFISPILFNNQVQRVIRSYQNKKTSEIIKNIYDDFIDEGVGNSLLETPEPIIDESNNNINCIIPNWYPIDAMCWVTERALNENNNADFLIYETYKEGFNFRSLDSLIKQDVKGTLTYEPSGGTANVLNDSKKIVNKYPVRRYKIIKSNDSNINRYEGMIRSKIITHDIINKTIGGLKQPNDFDDVNSGEPKYKWDYDENFIKSNHLGNNNTTDGFPIEDDVKDRSTNCFNFENNVSYHFKDGDLFQESVNNNIFPETFYLNRKAILNQFNTWILEVEILGAFNLQVGDTMLFKMPSHEAQHGKQTNQAILEMYSGKYIITSIRYIFKQPGLLMVMQLRKNALAKKYSDLDKLAPR